MFSENILVRIVIILIAVLIMIGIFGVIVRRGGVIFGFELSAKKILIFALGLILLFSLGMILGNLPWKWAEILGSLIVWIIYAIWVISPILIITDIVNIGYKLPAVGVLLACVLWIGIGFYQGIHIKTTNLNIANTKITTPHKIVFISDLHVDIMRNRSYVQSIVDHIQKIQPDFVMIGGDLMNSAKANYVDSFLPFNQLSMPIYATLGNHDHMGNSGAIFKIFDTTKIIPLRNTSVEEKGIQIVGIDDKTYRSGKKLNDILDESTIADNGEFTILISHQPQNLKKLEKYPIDLELAGHTHKGQFIPFSWIIGLFNDYSYGTYHLGEKTAFVSQGLGTWGAPIRMGTQSELVVISLVKSQ